MTMAMQTEYEVGDIHGQSGFEQAGQKLTKIHYGL